MAACVDKKKIAYVYKMRKSHLYDHRISKTHEILQPLVITNKNTYEHRYIQNIGLFRFEKTTKVP